MHRQLLRTQYYVQVGYAYAVAPMTFLYNVKMNVNYLAYFHVVNDLLISIVLGSDLNGGVYFRCGGIHHSIMLEDSGIK